MIERVGNGFIIRPPTTADALAIVDLINACSLAEGGRPDFGLPMLLDDWNSPQFALANDAWLALGPDERLLGYEQVALSSDGEPNQLDGYVHPDYKGQGIGTRLVQLVEQRVRAAPAASPIVHGTIEATNAMAQRLFASAGYRSIRYFWRMEIEQSAPPEPSWPAGITVRAFVPGQDDRATHAAIEEAFLDHWGHTPAAFEEWSRSMFQRVDFDPSLWFLAFDGEQIAGTVLSFARNEQLAWVRGLGVRRPWRGRRLGMALLQHAFAAFYARGMRIAGLGVDGQSPTGATHLYERAGMHVTEQYDTLEKIVK